jgi:ferritin-like metal-binding protein YciE
MKTESGTSSEQENRFPGEVAIARNSHVIHDLRNLFVAELKQLYHAEKILGDAILKIAEEVFDRRLADSLYAQQKLFQSQAARVDLILSRLDESSHGGHSDTIQVLVNEAENILRKIPKGPVYDAAAIMEIQKIHHLKITAYGTLWAFARAMGEAVAAHLLEEALVDERQADETLTSLALADINTQAANYRYKENSPDFNSEPRR